MDVVHQLKESLADRYLVEREIGVGGMATVYLAHDIRHNRQVALKVLNPELGAVLGPERFFAEIQVTANLQHPHLLPLFDSGNADGLLFYVMPFIEGETLRARLDREKQLPIDETVRLASAIASALDYAHRHGVIHRDLKPENILLHDGQPLVADFGIALAVQNAGGNRITQTGLSLGTPQYMSPEQATGDRVIDARTDIYSLGALTYEMLTGDPPHVGSSSQAIIARLMTEKPRSIRSSRGSVSPQLEGAIERALEKLPADRWTTAREFAEALSGARAAIQPTNASPSVPLARAPKRVSRMLIGAGIAVGVIITGSLAAMAWNRRPTSMPPSPGLFALSLPDSVQVYGGGGSKLALSRDGTALVVVGASTEGRALYLRRLEDLDAQRIRGSDSATAPVFSPDGKRLVFSVASTLRTLAVAGGSPRIIADSGSNPVWGDDGRIYYQRDGAIWSVLSDGGDAHLVAAPDSAKRIVSLVLPDMLPGNTHLLVTYRHGVRGGGIDSLRLGVVSIATGELTELGIRGTNGRYASSGHIVFSTSAGEVFAVPFSLGKRKLTGPPRLLVQNAWQGIGGSAGFAISQNGTLAYHDNLVSDGSVDLVEVDLAGHERIISTRRDMFHEPRISPDGKLVAVRIAATVDRGDLWIMDIATKTLTRLTTDTVSVRGEWTRKGDRIVYISHRGDSSIVMSRSWNRSGPDSIHVSGLWESHDGINEIALGPSSELTALRIGTSVTNPDIWIGKLNDRKTWQPVAVAQSAVQDREPRVSPNGRVLAYVSHESGTPQVYVTPLPGPGARVPVSVTGGTEPMWSPDGNTLYYRGAGFMRSARITERPALVVVQRDSLFRDRFAQYAWHQAYDVYPDGKRFLMTAAGNSMPHTSQLRIVTNWPVMLSREATSTER